MYNSHNDPIPERRPRNSTPTGAEPVIIDLAQHLKKTRRVNRIIHNCICQNKPVILDCARLDYLGLRWLLAMFDGVFERWTVRDIHNLIIFQAFTFDMYETIKAARGYFRATINARLGWNEA